MSLRPLHSLLSTGALASVALLVAAWATPVVPALADPYGEYRLKAAYLYRFAQYIEWPDGSFSAPDEPFTVCVLGKDPFGASLKELSARGLGGRSIAVTALPNAAAARGCHLVYGDELGKRDLGELHRVLGPQPVLLVSSSEGFAALGGGIGFVVDEGRVRIEINVDALRAANLKPNAKLLEVASRRIQGGAARP